MSLPVINFLELDKTLKSRIHINATRNTETMNRFLLIFTNEHYPMSEVLKVLSEAEFPLSEYLKELRIKNARREPYIYTDPFTTIQYTLNYKVLDGLMKKIENLMI